MKDEGINEEFEIIDLNKEPWEETGDTSDSKAEQESEVKRTVTKGRSRKKAQGVTDKGIEAVKKSIEASKSALKTLEESAKNKVIKEGNLLQLSSKVAEEVAETKEKEVTTSEEKAEASEEKETISEETVASSHNNEEASVESKEASKENLSSSNKSEEASEKAKSVTESDNNGEISDNNSSLSDNGEATVSDTDEGTFKTEMQSLFSNLKNSDNGNTFSYTITYLILAFVLIFWQMTDQANVLAQQEAQQQEEQLVLHTNYVEYSEQVLDIQEKLKVRYGKEFLLLYTGTNAAKKNVEAVKQFIGVVNEGETPWTSNKQFHVRYNPSTDTLTDGYWLIERGSELAKYLSEKAGVSIQITSDIELFSTDVVESPLEEAAKLFYYEEGLDENGQWVVQVEALSKSDLQAYSEEGRDPTQELVNRIQNYIAQQEALEASAEERAEPLSEVIESYIESVEASEENSGASADNSEASVESDEASVESGEVSAEGSRQFQNSGASSAEVDSMSTGSAEASSTLMEALSHSVEV